MMAVATSAGPVVTIESRAGGCRHSWVEGAEVGMPALDDDRPFSAIVHLGCEPHDYRHTWGYACLVCSEQFWTTDPEACCRGQRNSITYWLEGWAA
jgi:hypothetical protein